MGLVLSMREYNAGMCFISLFILAVLMSAANAQYWFQLGARGSGLAAQNNGAAVTIQTIIIEVVGFNVSLIRATISEITLRKIKFLPNFLIYFFFKCVSLSALVPS